MITGWFFMLSNQVINTDSNYKFMKGVVDGWLKEADRQDEDDIFIMFLPHSDHVEYKPDGFFDKHTDHVHAQPFSAPSRKNLQSKDFDAQFIYDKTRSYGLSTYFNNIPEIGAQLAYLVANYWAQGDMTPGPYTITYNHYTIHDTLPYATYGYEDLQLFELVGNYLSDKAVFNTEYHYSMMRDNADQFGTTHWLDSVERRDGLEYLPIPVLDDDLREHYEPEEDFAYDPANENVLFYYNHRLQAYKHWRDTFDLLNKFWEDGHKNLRVALSYSSGDNNKTARKEYPFTTLNKTHTHDEYYQKLRQPHFNTLNTTHETFCISIVESALLGGIPIVPDRCTFPEIFPDDYPFIFSDGDEQQSIIHNVLTGGYSEDHLTDIKHDLRDHFEQYNDEDIGAMARRSFRSDFMAYAQEHYDMLKNTEPVDKFFSRNSGREAEVYELYKAFRKDTNLGEQAMPTWRFTAILELYPHSKKVEGGDVIVRLD